MDIVMACIYLCDTVRCWRWLRRPYRVMPLGLYTDSAVGHEQCQQGGTGVGHELDPQPGELASG